MIWAIAGFTVLAAGLGLAIWATSLPRAFEARMAAAMAAPRAPTSVLTEADIAPLPEPVRRYIRLIGSLGRPVTILNDLCFFAPSRLADPALVWTPVDDLRARVSYTLGANTVSAELVFNAAGELVDFISEDRRMLQKDGSLRILRWSTPLQAYRDFGGTRVATEGEAIWHLPEGPFIYGRMQLTEYAAD